MTHGPATPDDAFEPLTDAEKQRAGALLSKVSTRTLLQTLARLNRQNGDSGLIIAALIERLPSE